MRLQLTFTPNTTPVPFAYHNGLINRFARWSGVADYGGSFANQKEYNFGWLQGSETVAGALNFPRGGTWTLAALDADLLQVVAANAERSPELFCGMRLRAVRFLPLPPFGKWQRFLAASPILIRHREPNSGVDTHLTYEDVPLCDDEMTDNLLFRMRRDGLVNLRADVRFDDSYLSPRTKTVTVHNLTWRANLCPIIIEGDPASLRFAWLTGVGHGIGSGFGFLEVRHNR